MTADSQLPPFLEPVRDSARNSNDVPFYAVYTHSERLGGSKAHCLWWPSKAADSFPKIIVLFIPGNPGLADFYEPYLTHIHNASPDSLAILGHSLLGHSPNVDPVSPIFFGLQAQVEGTIEVIDTIRNALGPSISIVLIGHSVGSWIVLQALKERADEIVGSFLLFPTISHIARTPNGERLSWLFRAPLPQILSNLSRLLRFVPRRVISLFFRDWPVEQFHILWSFINSPSAVLASLTLAHEEMLTIQELDIPLLEKIKHKLYFYLAEMDDWVGANKDTILREMADEPHSIRVKHGRHGIPHAYCISSHNAFSCRVRFRDRFSLFFFCLDHGKELADQSLQWLLDDLFSIDTPIQT
ncbi:hypothetical protein DFH11DRAFT_1500197 [Phellopilus nigrolimitatus]|nr:hypothetical protein DFH11DRAFT_1500197 [Phellopilus nigrolimitatus]